MAWQVKRRNREIYPIMKRRFLNHKKFSEGWDRIFYRKYPKSPELLCELYLKNVMLFYSDCPEIVDYRFLKFIEGHLKLNNDQVKELRKTVMQLYRLQRKSNKSFTWLSHDLLRKAICIATGRSPSLYAR